MIALIVAYTKNRVIGDKGRIPWRIKGEQRRFRELTTGNVVIMGRKSYEEIGHPLPNRFTVVVSGTASYEAENCTTAKSLGEAIQKAEECCPGKNIYISGGAGLYREAMDLDFGVQFSHTLDEEIGGQLRAGFMLTDIYEDTNGEGFLHEHGVPCFVATRCVKK